jgi:hypothetical protein
LIPVIIFFGHTIFAVYIFARSYQDEGTMQAFLNIAFIIILFAVGWTVTDFFTGFILPAEGWKIPIPGNNFIMGLLKLTGFYIPVDGNIARLAPKDSISLILLSIVEYYFYKFFFGKTKEVLKVEK